MAIVDGKCIHEMCADEPRALGAYQDIRDALYVLWGMANKAGIPEANLLSDTALQAVRELYYTVEQAQR